MANIVTVRARGPENNLSLGLVQTTGLLHALIGAQPPIAGAAPTQPIGFEHATEAALTPPITIPSREIRHNYLPHGSQPFTSPIEQLFYALIHLFSVQFVAEKPFIKIRINHHPIERAIDHLRGNTTQPSLLVGEIPHPLVVTTLVRNAPGQLGARTQILGHDWMYAGGVNRAFFFGRGGGHRAEILIGQHLHVRVVLFKIVGGTKLPRVQNRNMVPTCGLFQLPRRYRMPMPNPGKPGMRF